ncbi:MAG: DUF6731 family protein [Flavipsychrobacter sp.]
MAQKLKPLNLNFHQIVPFFKTGEDVNQEKFKEISNAFKNLPPKCRPLIRAESELEFYKDVRLDKATGLYLGTLMNTQTSGIAAKYKKSNQTLSKLGLGDDEGLGHPVNFLFDPIVNVVMMESVRGGTSVLGLCGLLGVNVNLPTIEPVIVINPAKMNEFFKMKSFLKFKVKIARVQNGNIFNQKRKKSIAQITQSADNTNTDTIEYALTVRKGSDSLSKSFIQHAVRDLLTFKDTGEVEVLEVAGKEEEDGRMETINLIEHALKDTIKVQKERLHGDFERDERFQLLIETYNKHKLLLRKVYSKHT